MAVGYAGVPFRVPVDDNGRLPKTVRRDRVRYFEAEILIEDSSLEDLAAFEADVTARPAIGGVDLGTLIIEGDSDFHNLIIPTSGGSTETWRAVLTHFESLAPTANDTWRCQVIFVLGNRV